MSGSVSGVPPKSKKSGSRDDPRKSIDPEGLAFLALLSETDRTRLAIRCAVPPGGDPIAGILSSAATLSVARRVIASLERDARDALLAMYMVGEPQDATETETLLRVIHGWTLARTKAALDQLRQHALLALPVTIRPLLIPFPTLARALGHDLIIWLAGGTPDAPPAPPFVRRLALLLAHIHADPVQRTQQHLPAVRWLERAALIFEPMGFPRQLLANLIAWLGGIGALDAGQRNDADHDATVSPDAGALLRGEPEDLVLAYATRDDTNPAGSLIAALVAMDRARQAGNVELPIDELSKVGKGWLKNAYDFGIPYHEEHVSLYGVAWAIRRLRILGLVEVSPKSETVTVRRIPAARLSASFRCTVLPTFEILVASDAEPAGTAELGRMADLVSADHVARFVLTAESLARAARGPGGADAAIAWLQASTEHGLPDGVRATITGWAHRAHALRMYEGTVVVAETTEHATWLRGHGAGPEIAPNVFRVDAAAVKTLRAEADAAKLPIVRFDGTPKRTGTTGGVYSEVTRSATEVRGRIERWAKVIKAKPIEAPKGKDRRNADVPDLSDYDRSFEEEAVDAPTNLTELRVEWPNVASAIRKLPELLEVVLRMPLNALDEMEFETTSSTEILRAITVWKRMFPEGVPGTTQPKAPTPTTAAQVPAPASPASIEAGTWTTMPMGVLTVWLAHAAAAGVTVEVVYVNASGVRSERKVVPLNIARAGRREWLDARDLTTGSTTRFDLDRIAAVRGR